MRHPLFVDTSAWFAFVNRSDLEHERTREAIEAFRGQLMTSNFIFDETVTLCRYRLGHEAAVRVGETLLMPRVVELVRASHEDEKAAWRLFGERSDQRYSFTDCVSFVMMRRLGLERAAALDDGFRREGFEVVP